MFGMMSYGLISRDIHVYFMLSAISEQLSIL